MEPITPSPGVTVSLKTPATITPSLERAVVHVAPDGISVVAQTLRGQTAPAPGPVSDTSFPTFTRELAEARQRAFGALPGSDMYVAITSPAVAQVLNDSLAPLSVIADPGSRISSTKKPVV